MEERSVGLEFIEFPVYFSFLLRVGFDMEILKTHGYCEAFDLFEAFDSAPGDLSSAFTAWLESLRFGVCPAEV